MASRSSKDEAAGHTSGMCRESVEQRGRSGTESAFFMAINEDDVVYILTKEDVDGIAKTIGLSKLTDEHYRMARKYMSSFCSDGTYTWVNAFTDALQDAEEGRVFGVLNPKNTTGRQWNLALPLC